VFDFSVFNSNLLYIFCFSSHCSLHAIRICISPVITMSLFQCHLHVRLKSQINIDSLIFSSILLYFHVQNF
jgi:hypothetical protein